MRVQVNQKERIKKVQTGKKKRDGEKDDMLQGWNAKVLAGSDKAKARIRM